MQYRTLLPNDMRYSFQGCFTYLLRKKYREKKFSIALPPSHHPLPRSSMKTSCAQQIRVMHIQNTESAHHNTICFLGSYSLFLKQFIPLCRAALSSFLLFLSLSLCCALPSLMCFDLSHVNYSDLIHADVCVYN